MALEAMSRFDEAEAAYASLLDSTDPERRTAARVGQARVRLARDDARGALAVLAKITTVDPGYALTVAQLRGDALLALDLVDDARDVYAALTGDAESRTVRDLGLGECALAREKAQDALVAFSAALDGTTDRYYQAEAHVGLVRAFAEAGKLELAEKHYELLRDEYADHSDAIARAGAALGR